MLSWKEIEKLLEKQQRLTHKACLLMTRRNNKLYDLEVLEGDYVYIGSDIKAESAEKAFELMMFLFDNKINEDSEIIHLEEKTIH